MVIVMKVDYLIIKFLQTKNELFRPHFKKEMLTSAEKVNVNERFVVFIENKYRTTHPTFQ